MTHAVWLMHFLTFIWWSISAFRLFDSSWNPCIIRCSFLMLLSILCMLLRTKINTEGILRGNTTTDIQINYMNKIRKKFSRISGIDCTKPFFEIRPGSRFFELISIFVQWDYIWTKIEISSKKRVSGRISKNGLVQSIPESLENVLIQRAHNSKNSNVFTHGGELFATTLDLSHDKLVLLGLELLLMLMLVGQTD